MKTIFVVYTCDAWHTHASKRIFGVFTTKNKAILAIKKTAKFYPRLVPDLAANNQTQGLEENFIIDETTLNAF
jgi:hypothetical protein